MVVLLLTCLFVTPVLAAPITYQMEASLPLGGVLTGQMTVDDAVVEGVNVRHLSGNQTYGVTDWWVRVEPSQALLPYLPQPLWFSGETSQIEVCTGRCVFGSGMTETVLVSDGTNGLRLAWQGAGSPWGTFFANGSEVDTPRYTIGLSQGRAWAVPEAATWLLLLVGVVGLTGWIKWCRG